RRARPRDRCAARAHPPAAGGDHGAHRRGDQPAPLRAVDPHHTGPAADIGDRHLRHEHQGAAVHRQRERVPVGVGPDGGLRDRGVPLDAARRSVQAVVGLAGRGPGQVGRRMRIITLTLAMVALVATAAVPAAGAGKDETIADWIPLPKEIAAWRAWMAERGFSFAITYVGDTLGNATGGTRQSAVHQGRFNFEGDLDFEKLAGWSGLRAHANVFSIYG